MQEVVFLFKEEDIKAVQQYRCQKAQLRLYQENLGVIRAIGLQYGVKDMEVYLQDAYLAMGDACRLYRWDNSFLSCLRVHLKKAAFSHRYRYEYPVRVNHVSCHSVRGAEMPSDVAVADVNYDYAEDVVLLDSVLNALSCMPKMDQEIVTMRYFEDRTLKEIAVEFNVSFVTIHNHLEKILRVLAQKVC